MEQKNDSCVISLYSDINECMAFTDVKEKIAKSISNYICDNWDKYIRTEITTKNNYKKYDFYFALCGKDK